MSNILNERWITRYNKLSEKVKNRIDYFDDEGYKSYSLIKGKGSRKYPEVGDMFEIHPSEDIDLYGVVINNHISNINGDDLILVAVLKPESDIEKIAKIGIIADDLLLPPQMLGKEYWTKGYFVNVGKCSSKIDKYCFYSVGKDKIFNEYGENAELEAIVGIFGVSTIMGFGIKIARELILDEKM
ncbi:hypothetical protein [Pseudobutyrivibrio sp. LB2011]|uniref:hypothetical protein n=1 Tax=Pseudobutyrivibrio sp. LB2011 TaxID=1408312 RepID=UPI0005D2A46A|nr:hypothetical protein [Pseudobutyrivibrio sp. LB2011]